MFRLEEDNSIDFLTQKEDLKKSGLQKVEDDREESLAKSKEKEVRALPDVPPGKIRMKIRFDYRGLSRPTRFLFGKKSTEEVAEEVREQKISFWQSIPLQGIEVEKVRVFDIYTIVEEFSDGEEEVSYAPMEITVLSDSLEDCIYLLSREEFRRVQILSPSEITLASKDIEKLFVKFSELFQRIYSELT